MMYVSLRDEDHTDQMLMGRKAAGQRIAARKTIDQLDAENVRITTERLNVEMFNRAALWLPDYFDNLRPQYPLLPATCPVAHVTTKQLPPLEVIPTPSKATLTRKETGRAGVLVSFAGKSVQAGEGNLAEAIQAVAPKRYAIIKGYQGAREIIATEYINGGKWYAFKLLADRDALTRFRAADCALVYVQGGEVAA